MKYPLLMVMIAAGATACVEGNNPVQLLDAVPLDPATCGQQSGPSIIRGSLNFNASTSYFTSFNLFSPLTAGSGTGRTDFFGNEIILNYESKNPVLNFKEERLPVYIVVEGGTTEGFIALNLIGTEARQRLESAVPTAPEAMTLLAKVKIKGKLNSGKQVETNEVTFPIQVSRAESCPGGQPPARDPAAPCQFPGQDGTPITCP